MRNAAVVATTERLVSVGKQLYVATRWRELWQAPAVPHINDAKSASSRYYGVAGDPRHQLDEAAKAHLHALTGSWDFELYELAKRVACERDAAAERACTGEPAQKARSWHRQSPDMATTCLQ